MNISTDKGFSLIEILVYISLLSILIVGVFSSTLASVYMTSKKTTFTEEDYKMLIKNYHEE